LATAVRTKLNRTVAGAPGVAGPVGPTGPAGAPITVCQQGANGLTSAGLSGHSSSSATATSTSNVFPPASVTLDRPGKVLVFVTGTFTITCGGSHECRGTFSAPLGGRPVPGLVEAVEGNAGQFVSKDLSLAGIITD